MTIACPRTTIAVGPQSTKGFGSPSPRPGRFIFSHYALLRFDPRLVLCGIFLFSLASSAHSQVTWLFSPYRVKVFIHFEPGLLSAEDDVHQFHKQVAAVLRPMLGNRWDFEVTGFPTEVISRSLDLRTPPPGDRLPPSWKKITDADKITGSRQSEPVSVGPFRRESGTYAWNDGDRFALCPLPPAAVYATWWPRVLCLLTFPSEKFKSSMSGPCMSPSVEAS